MAAGKLIPDEVIVGLVVARLGHKDCKDRGWLLDGFPRTAAQVHAKPHSRHSKLCILLDVHDQVVVERCVGRRLDPVTEKIYHLVFNPPPQEIAARMVHRDDDTHAAITERLRAYTDNIGSVLQYYECVARRIHGMRPAEEVFSDVER
ncbi:adenylate kinase-domain-containing protein [Baffinella frigidus]|nr:adenylate kinase-domain-containing protein [Cryptophyta sp. CCMP2293]